MEQIFWFLIIIFGAPIVISPILRAIAGKHAPVYEVETEEEAEARKKQRKKADDAFHHQVWWE